MLWFGELKISDTSSGGYEPVWAVARRLPPRQAVDVFSLGITALPRNFVEGVV